VDLDEMCLDSLLATIHSVIKQIKLETMSTRLWKIVIHPLHGVGELEHYEFINEVRNTMRFS
jgi:hypothetical protein